MACYNGQEAVATELVNRGANVNQPNQRGCTPLHLAAVSTNGALCLELLVNNGADVNMQVSTEVHFYWLDIHLKGKIKIQDQKTIDSEGFILNITTATLYYIHILANKYCRLIIYCLVYY